jgi:hypothetical protein
MKKTKTPHLAPKGLERVGQTDLKWHCGVSNDWRQKVAPLGWAALDH